MNLKLICCQVFTREMQSVIARSPHFLDVEILPMGLHDMGAAMRPRLQKHLDSADAQGFDAILLGYALCGRGTEGLCTRRTKIVIPRAHDCIGVLMGSRQRYQAYFEAHPGVYFRSPGWIEFTVQGQSLEPAFASAFHKNGQRQTLAELIAQYGEDNGAYLFEQYQSFRRHYSGLTYISNTVSEEEEFKSRARVEAQEKGWRFDELKGSLSLLERLVNGDWESADFLVVAPGATIHGTLGETIVAAR